MSYSYFNTTESSGPVLDKYESKAKTQDELILLYFKRTHRNLTPSELEIAMEILHNKHWPITSIRRALSNLTKRKLLQKLETQRDGPYGRPEHCWALPAGQQRVF